MIKGKTVAFGVLLLGLAGAGPALADGHEAKIQAYLDSSAQGWLNAAELLDAVDQQNIDNMALGENEIETLDQRWRQEDTRGGGSLMNSKLDAPLSAFLRGVKAASGGVITEIFVMDSKGLNVAQTDPTGDLMQGDEDKWLKTFPVGAKAVFIDAVEEDGDMHISQASTTLARGNGARVGAVTIGINLDALK